MLFSQAFTLLVIVLTDAAAQSAQCVNSHKGEATLNVRGTPGQRGTRGRKGDIGLPGSAGPRGNQGISGQKGNDGHAGAAGLRGTKGKVGAQGLKGNPGNPGPVGTPGSMGIPGTQGLVGPSGSDGLKGTKGNTGARGLKGDLGNPGSVGAPGHNGGRGAQGSLGATGPAAPKGTKGSAGAQGLKGQRGNRGTSGPIGFPGRTGAQGPEGLPGPTGPAAVPGAKGVQGEPGDTVLNKDEFQIITATLNSSVSNEFDKLNRSLMESIAQTVSALQESYSGDCKTLNSTLNLILDTLGLNKPTNKCGKAGLWQKVVQLDTTKGDQCPPETRTVTNSLTNQTACDNNKFPVANGFGDFRVPCTHLKFPINVSYSNVCGRVRGYHYLGVGASFGKKHWIHSNGSIDSVYAPGVSFTKGSPREHLWTYVIGEADKSTIPAGYKYKYVCPCAVHNYDKSYIPSFVGNDYYCESGFTDFFEYNSVPLLGLLNAAWNDPLWDGSGCYSKNNTCCERYGWFHREIQPSTDDIEVRLCNIPLTERLVYEYHLPIDQLEIWIM